MHRDDFPMLEEDIVYLDNGATTLKPKKVIEEMDRYYLNYTSNIHRGDYKSAVETNALYDSTRDIVKDFVHCNFSREVVFTSGTTESINMIVFGFMKYYLHRGDEVLLSKSEHASNILPWMVLSEEIGFKIKYVTLNRNYEVTLDNVRRSINENTRVVSLAHISNVIGDIRDVRGIGQLCHDNNILFCVDGAQSIPHIPINFKEDNIDFLAFSGHKMCGPTGVGVLVGKLDLLDKMRPLCYGGGMNQYFEEDSRYLLKSVPTKLEAGTPPIAEVIGLGYAIKYLEDIGINKIHKHEVKLKEYLVEQLEKIPNIIMYNKTSESGILAFNVKGVFAQDTAIYLNKYNIYVRAGNHCAKLLKDEIKIKNTVRISIYLYNNKKDIDKVVRVLKNSANVYKEIL
jgi:cysteine desulfurase/selenocysteine lyase